MTLRPGEVPGRAVAVFPFLKTSDQITLGRFTFRSTDDTTGLNAEDAAHIREIADMLYLQNDLRIRSAAYSMLPAIDLDKALRHLGHRSMSSTGAYLVVDDETATKAVAAAVSL
jgi:hypothetical protein